MSGGILGVVPARGGSKGIPNKNLRPLCNKPLLAYVRDATVGSGVVDRLVLTTDSEEIAELGRELGLEVPFLRPPELATDTAPMLSTLQHAVGEVERAGWHPEIVLLLQPTAPLRTPEHIRQAVEMLRASGGSSVVSVVRIPGHLSPQYAMRIEQGRLRTFLPEGANIVRRQDSEPAYSRDGTIYAMWRDVLMEQGDIYGSDSRPLELQPGESINLDTEDDWLAAERLLQA
jgi:CMP-N-acetylneuraminic acid synthetase